MHPERWKRCKLCNEITDPPHWAATWSTHSDDANTTRLRTTHFEGAHSSLLQRRIVCFTLKHLCAKRVIFVAMLDRTIRLHQHALHRQSNRPHPKHHRQRRLGHERRLDLDHCRPHAERSSLAKCRNMLQSQMKAHEASTSSSSTSVQQPTPEPSVQVPTLASKDMERTVSLAACLTKLNKNMPVKFSTNMIYVNGKCTSEGELIISDSEYLHEPDP